MDETSTHYNTPAVKKWSKQLISTAESQPKKAMVGLSTNKVIVTVFWDIIYTIHIDYLGKGKTITGVDYAN